MDQRNEKLKINQIRFSIGSYSERNKRIINKIAKNELFSSFECKPFYKTANTLESFNTINRKKSLTADNVDFIKYSTLPNPSKAQQKSINSAFANVTLQNDINNCPASINNGSLLIDEKEPFENKSIHPPKLSSRSISLKPDEIEKSGKVALIVSAYVGEPKIPSRLKFLPQSHLSISNSMTSGDASNSLDKKESINSRLQDELVATLKKYNTKNTTNN